MIDYFALALTHGLIAIALLRIAARPELDREHFDVSPADKAEVEPPAHEAKPSRVKRRRRDA